MESFRKAFSKLDVKRKGRSEQTSSESNGIHAFSGASNFALQDVNLSIVGRDLHINQHACTDTDIKNALQWIANPRGCSWDPSRACIQGTRSLHIEEISSWIVLNPDSQSSAEMFIIADSAGSGKSALAHTICQQAQKQRQLVAGFFFDKMEQQSTTSNMMGALIRGLCNVSDQIKRQIGEILVEDTTLATAPPVRQFEEIILPVLKCLPVDRPLVVVIDALDEESDIVLLHILRECVPRLPASFRFIAYHTSTAPLSLTGETNRGDIDTYITSRLSTTKYGPKIPSDLLDAFITKAEGLFLWAATVLNHLENAFDPVAELKDVVHGKSTYWRDDDDAVKKLQDLYLRILSKFKWSDSRFANKYQKIMGALVTVMEPLSLSGLAGLYAADGITEEDVHRLCKYVQPLLQGYSPERPQQPIRLLHLSVQEYLSKHAPPPYRLICKEHHIVLSRLCLTVVKRDLNSTNVPMLGFTEGDWVWDPRATVPEIPELARNAFLEYLWYSCRFLGNHTLSISEDDFDDEHLQLICDVIFANPRPILEVTAGMGHFLDIIALQKHVQGLYVLGSNDPGASARAEIYYSIARSLYYADFDVEALPVAQSAVSLIRETLQDRTKQSTKMQLAMSLDLVARCLGDLAIGRHDESLQIAEEAVSISRELDAASMQDYRPLLVMTATTRTRAMTLQSSPCPEVVAATRECVEIYRQLFKTNAAEYADDLVSELIQLSAVSHLYSSELEFVQAVQEAVKISRRLVAENIIVFPPIMARALVRLSLHLSDEGKVEDGLRAGSEALDLYRNSVAEDPDSDVQAGLGEALRLYSVLLNDDNRMEEAVLVCRESVELYRQLVAGHTSVIYSSGLAESLAQLGCNLDDCGRTDEGLSLVREAIEIQRQGIVEHRSIFLPGLGISLLFYCSALMDVTDNPQENISHMEEMVAVRREISKSQPRLCVNTEVSLAGALSILATEYIKCEVNKEEAIQLLKESVEIIY
ncbi:hypothetical protein FA15DRAFT_758951 [Coprinopsis marcescibilis]|uniref:Nephrocystin 3-like N-terminal domain-containing protein n=1 Tax=Coprinopsis marcescibilis TaxID=230819 RepID=A0A5C3KL68_COPMA|nr:hypothetical protein FA15DRAFT_758951 [Coprinopsis marcescibilis]